jgi:hypothetical protein
MNGCASPVVVEDLGEDAGVSVEEVLVEDGVVVGQRFGETRQTRGRNLLQRGLVSFVPDASAVEDHTVLGVHVEQRHHQIRRTVFEGHRGSADHHPATNLPHPFAARVSKFSQILSNFFFNFKFPAFFFEFKVSRT